MATMSTAHVEITHQIRRLGQLIDEIGPNGLDEVDITELRSLLYGLHAILKLHTAQEDENYLSLADDPSMQRRLAEVRCPAQDQVFGDLSRKRRQLTRGRTHTATNSRTWSAMDQGDPKICPTTFPSCLSASVAMLT